MEDGDMALIEVKHLKYRYPGARDLALKDISFTVEKGEFLGIVGANGAGKSSLSQALLGLIPQFYKGAYGGSVFVEGMDTAHVLTSKICRKAGLVFQNPFNQLSGAKDTVYDEVGFGLQNFGVEPEEIRRRVQSVLESLGIWEFRDRNPFDLSGGQLQRVAIASVLAMTPDILILDEPTSQLDPEGAEEVFRTVDELTKSGITILMIEQKIEKLAGYCDRVLLMHEGRLIDADTPRKLFSRPDLKDYGVKPPVVTEFAAQTGIHFPDGSCPVTVEESHTLLKTAPYRDRIPEFKERLREMEVPATAAITANVSAALSPQAEADACEETLRAEHICFSYVKGTEILRELSLTLDHRPTAIIGQNGAGKTTLVRILKGLLRPESGTITYRGESLAGKTVAELAGRIGYVFQNPDDQIFKYSVKEEVMFGPRNIGMSRAEAEKCAMEALTTVGLERFATVNPYDLELSQRKLVAIASVLAMNPDVLILDEPTIAQDARGRDKLREIMEAETRKGRLVLAILHDMDFVAESFQRVIVMAHGEILADGSPEVIFRQQDILQKAALAAPHRLELMEALETVINVPELPHS